MNKKQIELMVIVCALAAFAYLFHIVSNYYYSAENVKEKVESYLDKEIQITRNQLNDTSYYKELILSFLDDNSTNQALTGQFLDQNKQTYIFENDNLLFWSNNSLSLSLSSIKQNLLPKEQCLFIGNDKYIKLFNEFTLPNSRRIQVVSLIKINKNKAVSTMQVSADSINLRSFKLNLKDLDTFCHITIDKSIRPYWNRLIPIISLLIGIIVFCLLLHHSAKKIVQHYSSFLGASFLLLSVGVLRYLSIYFGWSSILNEVMGIHQELNSSFMSGTIADILINAIIAFWLILFFNKEISIQKYNSLNYKFRLLLTITNYFTIILGLLLLCTITQSIVVNSGIQYDFENVFNLNKYSFLSLLGILIMLLSLFLFSNRMMETVNKLSLSKNSRLASALIACLISLPILHASSLDIHPFLFYLATLIYIVLFDIFIDNGKGSTNWLIVWLIVLAGLSSLLLFNYNAEIDIQNRLKFSKLLENIYNADARKSWENITNLDLEKVNERSSDDYLEFTRQYDYAIYKNGERVAFKGSYYQSRFNYNEMPQVGDHIMQNDIDRLEFIYKANTNTNIVIGKKQNGIIKPLSLFSYVFALLLLLVALIAIFNRYFPFLPDKFNFYIHAKPSLSNKIQFAVISLIISSFIIIALVTFMYFRNTSNETQLKLLNEKSFALQADISKRIITDSIAEWGPSLEQEIASISIGHQINFQVYDIQGNLKSAPVWNQINLNRIADKMDMNALLSLRQDSQNYFILDQPRGQQDKTSFMSIKSYDGKDLIYLSVPMYSEDGVNRSEINNFMGTLLNVYVFLFLIAGAIAIAVANSITQPLSVIGEKLKNIRLGKRNEPLKWDNQDELGDLIRDYNSMIKEIDDSTELLATTQRDMAWREMAKQIAHEIKNPLTPMKLSIQHLQYAIKSEKADLPKLVKRVSSTLIEQIDNLAGIASEFTNFAKLPQAANEKTILNDIVSSVHDLFRKRDDMDINLYVPIDEIYVFADKNHLIRILNNLLNNAIQAIPTDKRGKIEIELYKEGKSAIIKVSDNGVGIPDDMRDKVFSPNFTTKSSGTGLGLAIATNMAETFNGKIYFESLQNGTAFYLQVPLMHMEDNFDNPERIMLT